MKVAVIGSREFKCDARHVFGQIEKYLPRGCAEIVSGGAVGVDTLAKRYAERNRLRFTCFEPDYIQFGKTAPLVRNDEIIDYSDFVLVIWNGESNGSRYVINKCIEKDKPMKIVYI